MKKINIITGASRGIGRAIAEKLAKRDEELLLMARTIEDLESFKQLNDSGKVHVFKADLLEPGFSKPIVDFLQNNSYSVHALVNNAGQYERGELQDTQQDSFLWQMQINFFAVVELTRAILPYLNSGSALVNISSTLGIKPVAGVSAYAATKAALNNFSHTMALELAAKKITVNSVCPGLTNTAMHNYSTSAAGSDERKQYDSMQPIGRIGEPEEIASAVEFLVSESAKFVTGIQMPVDGGINL